MIKVLHTADIHLDTPFNIGDITKAQVKRSELRGAFSSLFTFARIEKYDIVLIAGDMFDCNFVTPDTIALVMREFSVCHECRFVISPGNHDPYTPDSVWSKLVFPDNVYIFKNPELECFSFDDLGVNVYGYAFSSTYMDSCPFSDPPVLDSDRINILCGHGDLSAMPSSRHCPIRMDDIIRSGFDYIALGHIHNSDGVHRTGRTWYGYSGCLDGRDFGECGYKGAISIMMEKTDGVFEATVKGKLFSKRRFETMIVDLTGSKTDEEVLHRINEKLFEKHYGEDTALKLILEGSISPEVTLSDNAISDYISSSLFFAVIDNRTDALYNYEMLKNDPTVRGAFFSALYPQLTSDDEEERQNASAALRYGLSALRGNDIF